MKKIITLAMVFSFCLINAQAFKGKGDTKFNVGANLQDGGTGIQVSTDFGIGENISYGVVAGYVLGGQSFDVIKPKFEDRIDVKVRFNANLGNVINVDEKFDVYTVRRLDGECLNYHVPDGLLLNIYNAGKYDKEVLKNLQAYVHFDTECMNAVVDFKRSEYEDRDIDFIISEIEEEYTLKL